MSPWKKWSFTLLMLASATSGLAYLWLRYLVEPTDPFSVVNHPLEPWLLDVHLLTAPPLILVFGIVFQSHIADKLSTPCASNRRSGWVSLAAFGVMTASGYLLETVTGARLLRVMFVVHLTSGGLFVLGYGVHLVLGLRLLRAYDGRAGKASAIAPP